MFWSVIVCISIACPILGSFTIFKTWFFFFFSFVFVSLYIRCCLQFVYEEVLLSYGLQLKTMRRTLKPRRDASDAEPSAHDCTNLTSSLLESFFYLFSLIQWAHHSRFWWRKKEAKPPSKLILSMVFFARHSQPKKKWNKPAWRTQ